VYEIPTDLLVYETKFKILGDSQEFTDEDHWRGNVTWTGDQNIIMYECFVLTKITKHLYQPEMLFSSH